MEITEIKSKLTLKRVLDYYNLKPDKQLRLNCPFHDDKTPSLQVYYKTHTCYCFSSNCSTHGKSLDVIDFILHKESCTKHEAILKAKSLINGTSQPVQELTRAAILTKMFTYFKNAVHNSKSTQGYLQSRNLDYTKIEVGYNSGQFHHGARKDKYLIDSCVKVGLLAPTGGQSRTGNPAYKPFGKNGIVFPLKNKKGQIISMYFRNTAEIDHRNRHYYLKNRQGLYPHYPRPTTRKLILTEAIIDAATLMQQNQITNQYEILSLFGTNGLTEEHLAAIKGLKDLEEIVFFFDGDEAGRSAMDKYRAILLEELPSVKSYQVLTPDNEDVNSLLDGHTHSVLYELLNNRQELGITKGQPLFFSNEIPTERKNQSTTELNTKNPSNLIYKGQSAEYQIKGFKLSQLDSLKVSLRITNGVNDFRAKAELYEHKQTEAVSRKASELLELDQSQIEKELSRLTTLLEAYRETYQDKESNSNNQPEIKVPEATIPKCLELLKSKDYFQKLNELIGKTGVIGENESRLLLYVIASTYKMEDTLHALVQGSSGSGKTHLITKIAELMPTEHTTLLTRVTESSFYNYGEYDLKNTLLIMEDLDGLKEEAFLAFRELQSRGMLNSSTSVKDEQGNIKAAVKTVRGPIASLSATTKGEIYEDNMSRSLVIAVDESKEQTANIIKAQNDRAAGNVNTKQEQKIIEFLQHCMRLIKPYEVVNPFANKVQLPEEAHKIRRLNQLYQAFVKQITILHQFQRKRDQQGRLITEKSDLQNACKILFDCIVLKVDELDGSLRDYFEKLKQYVKSKAEKENKSQSDTDFTRIEIRQALKVSKTRQHVYMQELQDFEYVKQVNGYANKGFKYKVGYWDSLEALRAKIQDHLDKQLEKINA
jgi:DNA primase/energy-coupling factor transporter ATP-binding protein EcfA2